MQRNASDAHAQILGHIGVHRALPMPFFGDEVCALRGLAPGLARGSERRNSAVRRIYDERSAMVRPHAVLPRLEPVSFEVVVGGGRIVLGVAAANRAVKRALHARVEERLRFLVGQKFTVAVLGGTLHGRIAEAGPISVQVGMAVRRARHHPRALSCRRLCVGFRWRCLRRDECRCTHDRRYRYCQSAQ